MTINQAPLSGLPRLAGGAFLYVRPPVTHLELPRKLLFVSGVYTPCALYSTMIAYH